MTEDVGRVRADTTKSFGVSAFPIKQWDEWDKDCKDNFGDCRWIKMWRDHEKSKSSEKIELIEERLARLEGKFEKKEESKDYVETFGGKIELKK